MAALTVFGAMSCKKENPSSEPDVPGRMIVTLEKPVVIDWDYKYYDDIKDFYPVTVHVDGDRNNLVPCTEQGTWNLKTGFIYTQGMGAISKHTNNEHAIDINLVSSAEYGVKDSTYVLHFGKRNEEEGITYFSEINYVVKARPADALIELDPIDVKASDETIQITVSPMQAAYSLHKQYYSGYTFEEVAADFAHDARKEYIKATIDGKFVAATANCYFSFNGIKERSYLYAQLDRPGKWRIYVYTHFANVGYNFVFPINVVK